MREVKSAAHLFLMTLTEAGLATPKREENT